MTDTQTAAATDPSGLVGAFLALPDQLERAFEETTSAGVRVAQEPGSITFCGMGGSAAAGDVALAAGAGPRGVPVATWRDYSVPAYCDDRSAIVALSYSGNTEEALSAYDEARTRGASLVAVCAGGALAERAERDGVPLALVPGDAPMPRAALGYLAGAVLAALAADRLRDDVSDASRTLREVADGLAAGEAGAVAEWVGDAVPVVWASGTLGSVAAWRWKSAFNENAKIPAFASTAPELNHHEVVGWTEGTGRTFRLLILRHDDEHPSVEPGLRATLDVIGDAGLEWREVHARGSTRLAQALSLIMLGDVATALHAIRRGVDPAPIEAIARIKARLAERS